MHESRFNHGDRGFSLLETVIATGLIAGAITALAQMFAISVANNISARSGSYATVLAGQKMEQLRGLRWGFDALGAPISDTTTDITIVPEAASGGTGLSPSPADSLRRNAAGYCDFIDRDANSVGGGTTPPAATAYIRRWSVQPLPDDPDHSLVFQVLVTPWRHRGAVDPGAMARLPDEAYMVSVKTRKAS